MRAVTSVTSFCHFKAAEFTSVRTLPRTISQLGFGPTSTAPKRQKNAAQGEVRVFAPSPWVSVAQDPSPERAKEHVPNLRQCRRAPDLLDETTRNSHHTGNPSRPLCVSWRH